MLLILLLLVLVLLLLLLLLLLGLLQLVVVVVVVVVVVEVVEVAANVVVVLASVFLVVMSSGRAYRLEGMLRREATYWGRRRLTQSRKQPLKQRPSQTVKGLDTETE